MFEHQWPSTHNACESAVKGQCMAKSNTPSSRHTTILFPCCPTCGQGDRVKVLCLRCSNLAPQLAPFALDKSALLDLVLLVEDDLRQLKAALEEVTL